MAFDKNHPILHAYPGQDKPRARCTRGFRNEPPVADRGHPTVPGRSDGGSRILGTRPVDPTVGPGSCSRAMCSAFCSCHRGAQQAGLTPAGHSSEPCTDTQCGFVVFLVSLFLQKPKEICRLGPDFLSLRMADLLGRGQAELS